MLKQQRTLKQQMLHPTVSSYLSKSPETNVQKDMIQQENVLPWTWNTDDSQGTVWAFSVADPMNASDRPSQGRTYETHLH